MLRAWDEPQRTHVREHFLYATTASAEHTCSNGVRTSCCRNVGGSQRVVVLGQHVQSRRSCKDANKQSCTSTLSTRAARVLLYWTVAESRC